jgi:hypothetical protein
MPQEYGLIGEKIKAKVFENQGKVSFAFGIAPILDEAKAELLTIVNSGVPLNLTEYSCLIVKWFEKWFGNE